MFPVNLLPMSPVHTPDRSICPLNSNHSLRKVLKNKKALVSNNALRKILYLGLKKASEKWTMPIRNWPGAMQRFAILFSDRFPENI